MKPVDLYVRVSRVGGRENLISPDEQERRGRELAAQHNLTVGELLVDLDESGGKWDRPGLQEALRRVEHGESAGVIVAWLDRLSRDSEHAHQLVRRITDAGGRIYAPDAPADWTTPEGGLQAGILFEFAAYVRKRAGASFERAKEQAIERGIPVNNRAAAGYRKGEDRRLEIDPDTGPVIRDVFAARVRGAGPTELGRMLEACGVTTSQGSKTWSKEAVAALLRNRVYLGELAYGKDRRFVNTAAHEPIVDLATWEMAQPNGVRRGVRGRRYLLAGLLRCTACRYCMQGTTDAHRNRVYRCKRRHAAGVCERPARARIERVEAAVVADLFAHMPKMTARGKRDRGGRVGELARTVELERGALTQWASPHMQAEIGDLDLYIAGMRERRDRVAAAEAAHATEVRIQAAAHAFPAAVSWQTAWERMNVEDRLAVLASRYDCIQLRRNPDLLVIYPTGVGPADLPSRAYRRAPVLKGFDDDVPDGARILAL